MSTTESVVIEHVHTISQTEQVIAMVAGFPTRDQLLAWLHKETMTVYCLFPSSFKSDQVQLQLRDRIFTELKSLTQANTSLAKLHVSMRRCMALVLSDADLGTTLETFDFERACQQTIKQLTPKAPYFESDVAIPEFGDA
jgi:hypothetical protein